MGEYERMARAGHYIADLEGRINAKLLASATWRPLRWEGWLREGGNAPSRVVGGHHRYLAIASVFIGFQLAAVTMGLHFYLLQHSGDESRKWLIPVAVAINAGILFTLLGYFRSSYERLRKYTVEPEERDPPVRQRVRMRLKLYGIVGTVGFVSAPLYSWPLGIAIVWAFNRYIPLGDLRNYWIALPTLVWMGLIPLISSRGLMRELLTSRILAEEKIEAGQLKGLEDRGLLSQLTEWEKKQLCVVQSEEINAPSIGRNKRVTVTSDALADEENFPGVLAHEVGHHRLHHLHPLALSYIYLWPYLYYDDRVLRLTDGSSKTRIGKVARVAGRALFSLAAMPGWLAWLILRWGWRTAEYDADRFACVSGHGKELAAALDRHEEIRKEKRPTGWKGRIAKGWERIGQGRGLGYLPVPNEHPIPKRRVKRMKKWLWKRPAPGGMKSEGHVVVPGESSS
jgi:Zn-dependent protease with chaperone function